MGSFFNKIARKEDPAIYQNKDGHLKRTLQVRDFLTFRCRNNCIDIYLYATWHCCCRTCRTGRCVIILTRCYCCWFSCIYLCRNGCRYAILQVQPYSWVNVLFGEFFGWVAGWALLAEYFIAVAFVASGFSANLRGLVKPIGIELPAALSNPFVNKWRFYRYYCCYRYFINCIITITWYVGSSTYGKHFSYFKSISYYFICNRRF